MRLLRERRSRSRQVITPGGGFIGQRMTCQGCVLTPPEPPTEEHQHGHSSCLHRTLLQRPGRSCLYFYFYCSTAPLTRCRCLPPRGRSCLYRWQLSKAEHLRFDVDTCEVCRQPYRIPPGAVDALVAGGQLPAPPRAARLWRVVGPAVRGAYRLLRPALAAAEVVVPLVGAADYALAAYRLAPAVLERPALLEAFTWDWALAAASLLAFPVVYALRADDERQQMQRIHLVVGILKLFVHSSAVVAIAVTDHTWSGRTAANPALAPHVRQAARNVQALDRALVSAALPLAAAFVGACSAWWRLWLAWLAPAHEAAAFRAACGRLGAAASAALQASGVLPHLRALAAAVGGSAAAQRLCQWAAALGVGLGAGGKRPPAQGSLEQLLRQIERVSGLDAAGAFSA